MQSSAAATGATCLQCMALVAGQHPELVLLISNPAQKPQSPAKTFLMWVSLLHGCHSLLPSGKQQDKRKWASSWARGGLDWIHFFTKKRGCQDVGEAVHHPWRSLWMWLLGHDSVVGWAALS